MKKAEEVPSSRVYTPAGTQATIPSHGVLAVMSSERGNGRGMWVGGEMPFMAEWIVRASSAGSGGN